MSRELGSTRHNPRKLIDSWVYKVKDVEIDRMDWIPPEDAMAEDNRPKEERYKKKKDRIVNKTVTVQIFMTKRTTQSEEPPHPLESVELEIVCKELDLHVTGTDLSAMKDGMWSMLDKKFEIKWESYYHVQIQPSRVYHGTGTGLEISYDDIYKGTTWDGKTLMRRWNSRDFEIKPWPGAFKDDKGRIMACIPATEENRQALKEFCKRLDLMREKLAEFLRPDNIVETFKRLSALSLLPQLEDKDEDESEA